MHDLSFMSPTIGRIRNQLTLNLGVRWDWFGWPTEQDGRIGNFDFEAMTNTENPVAAFIVPDNVKTTGFAAIDWRDRGIGQGREQHTLKGQDLNNFAPRFGFAYSPFDSNRLVIRGGYGIFFDRPSAAFMNTIFSNYPFLREIEVTAPTRGVPLSTAFSQQDPNLPFNRICRTVSSFSRPRARHLCDSRRHARDEAGQTARTTDRSWRRSAALGNIAETFEFRAIDRNLRTPYIQQWNLGFQYELTKNLLIEARYVGPKERSCSGDRLQPGLRPERPEHARLHLRAFQRRLRRGLSSSRRPASRQLAALFLKGALRTASTSASAVAASRSASRTRRPARWSTTT